MHDAAVACIALALLVGGTLMRPETPSTPLAAPSSACWVARCAHVPCPGCGLTRSCVAFLHGRVRESLAWHPAGPLHVVAAVAALASVTALAARRARPLWGRATFVTGLGLLGAATLVAGTCRWIFPS